MKRTFYTLIFVSLLAIVACNNTQTQNPVADKQESAPEVNELHDWAKTIFSTLPEVAENKDNPITEEKVSLGKKLYYDKILSKDNTISCNSCHDIARFGVDQLATSPGNDGIHGNRNSPTTLNAALHATQFWDGREPDVEAQAGGPVLNPVEMAMASEEEVIQRLSAHNEYPGLFASAFPEADAAISYDNMKKAIGAFERTLITESRFDKYLAGDVKALNETELAGLNDFKEAGCQTCHMGNALGGNMFQKFGVYGDYWELTKSETIDNGKFDLSGNEAEKYFFKVPSLRNIEHTFPYFHDGSVKDLKESVKIMAKAELNKELTEEQADNIVAFLKSLTGEIKAEWLEEAPEA